MKSVLNLVSSIDTLSDVFSIMATLMFVCLVFFMVLTLISDAKKAKWQKNNNKVKRDEWGAKTVLFKYLTISSACMIGVCGISWIISSDKPTVASVIFVVCAAFFCIMTRREVKDYWKEVSKKSQRDENRKSIEKTVGSWFGGQALFEKQQLLMYWLSIEDNKLGAYEAHHSSKVWDSSPLAEVDPDETNLYEIMEQVRLILSSSINGFNVHVHHMEDDLLMKICDTIRGGIEYFVIVTQDENSYHVFMYWLTN